MPNLFVGYQVVCSTLWSAFGETVTREGNKAIVSLSIVFQYGLWTLAGLAGLGIVCAIIFYIILPSIGNFLVDRAEARELNKNASRDVLQGFGGSEYLVRHYPSGQMTVYNPVENLVSLIASGGIDSVLAEAIGRIVHSAPATKIGRIETTYGQNDGTPLLTEPQPELLPNIINLANILVVGGKGSGKTTLLQWIEAQRVRQGKTIVLDSHTQPGTWQGTVIGIGRNYRLIRNAMVGIVTMLDNRYKSFARGQNNFEPIHTFIDEFTMLPRTLKQTLGYNIQDYSVPVLTEGRKVKINAIWGIHSDRAKMLGFEGMADLKESFDAIVYLKNVKGQFYAWVDFGEGIDKSVKYQLPGPFIIQGQAEPVANDGVPILGEPVGDVWDFSQPEPEQQTQYDPKRAQQIRDLADQGMSKTDIARHFGYKQNAGAIYYEIKAALGETE